MKQYSRRSRKKNTRKNSVQTRTIWWSCKYFFPITFQVFFFFASRNLFFSQNLSKIWSSLSTTISTPVIRFMRLHQTNPEKWLNVIRVKLVRRQKMILKMRICFLVRSLLEKKKVLCSWYEVAWVSLRLSQKHVSRKMCVRRVVPEKKRKEKCFIRFTLSLKTKKVGGAKTP